MPTVYACDICHETATSLAGWFLISVSLLHDDPNVTQPPYGRTLDSTYPDLLFDKETCRDEWLAQAGLAKPTTR